MWSYTKNCPINQICAIGFFKYSLKTSEKDQWYEMGRISR